MSDATADRTRLRQILTKRLTLDEVTDAAWDMGMDDDGQRQSQLARALIDYLDSRGRLDQLVAWLKAHRPDIPIDAER
jgi:hypothetical protein